MTPPVPLPPLSPAPDLIGTTITVFVDYFHDRVSPSVFDDAYGRVISPRGFSFASIMGCGQGFRSALQTAAVVAMQEGFFQRLVAELATRISVSDAVRESLAPHTETGLLGEHHAVFAFGQRSARWIDALHPILPRVGVIAELVAPGTLVFRGTGFLVGPDKLLTAAHVVWPKIDYAAQPFKVAEGSWDGLVVAFHNERVRLPNGQPRIVGFARDWLLSSSPPCGTPPAMSSDNALAVTNLDFALIRLAEPVGDEFGYMDIAEPKRQQAVGGLAVVGYPGASDCLYHVGDVEHHDMATSRLRHRVDAQKGMSGGPCVAIGGNVVAIHEGATPAGQTPRYNRAVHLLAVRELMRTLEEDPLESGEGVSSWLPPNESRPLLDALGMSDGKVLRRHPVFGRQGLLDWIEGGLRTSEQSRFGLVSGEDGAGKTFTGALLRARVATGGIGCVASFSPEVARDVDMEAVFGILREAVPRLPETRPSTSVLRPHTGLHRYDQVPAGLDMLERDILAARNALEPLWVFVDVGRDANWSSGRPQVWMDFLAGALARPWLRVVLTGVSRTRHADFLSIMPAGRRPFTEYVTHTEVGVLEEFVTRQTLRGGKIDTDAVRAAIVTKWRALAAEIPADQITATAARMAIELKDTLMKGASR